MDFHKIPNVTLDKVKEAHTADEAVQEKYGVRYHQYWVNQEEGTVFCLVEGPDAATCELVHQTSHGNIACALTEVKVGFFQQLMGHDHKINHGLVQHADGSEDPGYRSILSITSQGLEGNDGGVQELITENIKKFNGRELKSEYEESIAGVFDEAGSALQCALLLRKITTEAPGSSPVFSFGISSSQPVTMDGDFFKGAIRLAHHLSLAAPANSIIISSLTGRLCRDQYAAGSKNDFETLGYTDEAFISKLISMAGANLSEQEYSIDSLCLKMGVSRPQFYRKVKALTGRAPNDFINDLRLFRAVSLLKQQRFNISEVSFETGYSSPSYFTKCFVQKFGCKPSLLLKTPPARDC